MADKYLLWVDAETSGLRTDSCKLLEIAGIVTDYDLNVISDGHYHAVIKYTPEEAKALYESAEPYVQKMHTETGLWDKLASDESVERADVDEQLRVFLRTVTGGEQQVTRLAGNSVRLDLNFVEDYLPLSYADLAYRMFDVSSIAAAAQKWHGAKSFRKVLAHTALGDINESLNEARYLRAAMGA